MTIKFCKQKEKGKRKSKNIEIAIKKIQILGKRCEDKNSGSVLYMKGKPSGNVHVFES